MANKYFDIKKDSEGDICVPLSKSAQKEQWISKYLAKHFQKISKLEEDLLRVPTTDEFFFLQSESSFNAFDFLLLIVKREPVKNCYARSEEHTSELQSRENLVCRLLLEKKKK